MATSTLQISKTKYRNFKIAAAGSTAALVIGGMAFLQPFSFSNNSYADSSNTDISINIGETIMLPELSQEAINLNLEPNVDGDFTSASIDVRMSTNHVSGYTLTMSTEGTETALTSSDFDNYKIDALNSKTSATDFANLSSTASINKWGYATDNNGDGEGQTEANYYYGITNKDNPTTIKITDGPTNSSETNVTFATKGKDLAAGTYSNVVVFSAVGNAIPATTLEEAQAKNYTMQQLAPSMCAKTPNYDGTSNTEYTFTDSRDNEEYVIRKLKDDNCWMTSNLRLRGENLASGVSTTLNSTNTNLTSGSTFILPSSATWTDKTTITKGLLYSGNADAKIGSSGDTVVSGIQAQARGTYYTWCIATADCSSAAAAGDPAQPNSICPKGWKLPNSDGSETDTNQFYKLYNAYAGSSQYADFMSAYNYYYSNGAAYYLAGLWHTGRYVDNSGTSGYWWSSTPYSSDAAYAWSMSADTSSVHPAFYNYRYSGRSVRCVLVGS